MIGNCIRRSLVRAIKWVGYTIVRTSEFEITPRSLDPPFHIDSLGLIELAIEARFPDPKSSGPFLLQIGACDGHVGDPVHAVIERWRLPCVLVEPVPESFARLCETYQDNAAVTCVQVAIHRTSQTATMFTVDGDFAFRGKASRDGGWGSQLSSFDREHLVGRGVPESMIRQITVPCVSLRSLCESRRLPRIDVLQVDAEGYDAEVVKMAIEMTEKPDIIHFEYVHLNVSVRNALIESLRESGYRAMTYANNVLAMR